MAKHKYAKIMLELVPRALSNLDTNELSETYGCFDKAYWWYKTSDFSCARAQEFAFTLALLYKNRFKDNTYYSDENIKKLAIAGIEYLTKIQRSDGSFDEWYPNEHSFVGTAFPLYKAAETFMLLRKEFTEPDKVISCLEKAARFIMRNKGLVPNQEAGAIVSLYDVFLITGKETYKQAALTRLDRLSSIQSSEGWFDEYGGADPGYLSLLIDFMALMHKRSGEKLAAEIALKAIEFEKYFVHPDGSIGGVYGSRGTEFKLPYGLEYFSRMDAAAAYMASKIYANIENTTNPLNMDDVYALKYNDSYLMAFLEKNPNSKKSNVKLDRLKHFKQLGVIVLNDSKRMFVCNLKKGGVFKYLGKVDIEDSGFAAVNGKKTLTTQWNNSSTYQIEGDNILIKGNFKVINNTQRLSPINNILLRMFLATIGKSNAVGKALKQSLKKKMITKVKNSPMVFRREINLGKNIMVKDTVSNTGSLDSVYITSGFRSNYVPTSRFYSSSALKGNQRYLFKGNKDIVIKRELI